MFSFRVLAKEDPTPRIAIVVGRKVGKAVVRNRVKRAVREAFRKNKQLFAHLDLVVVPRPLPGVKPLPFDRLWLSLYLP